MFHLQANGWINLDLMWIMEETSSKHHNKLQIVVCDLHRKFIESEPIQRYKTKEQYYGAEHCEWCQVQVPCPEGS
jgi:hypothetical protein